MRARPFDFEAFAFDPFEVNGVALKLQTSLQKSRRYGEFYSYSEATRILGIKNTNSARTHTLCIILHLHARFQNGISTTQIPESTWFQIFGRCDKAY